MRFQMLLLGSVAGVSLMFFIDPDMGSQRRAILYNLLVRIRDMTTHQVEEITEEAATDPVGL